MSNSSSASVEMMRSERRQPHDLQHHPASHEEISLTVDRVEAEERSSAVLIEFTSAPEMDGEAGRMSDGAGSVFTRTPSFIHQFN